MATSKTSIDLGYRPLPQTRLIDRHYSFFHDALLQPNVATTATYRGPGGTLLTRTMMERAIRQLLADCPRLSTTVVRERDAKGRPQRRAVQLDRVDLDTVLVFLDEPGLTVDDVLDREGLVLFPPAPVAPHWRVAVLHGRHVVLFFNHVGFDGMSTLAFHRRLLAALNGAASPSNDQDLVPSHSRSEEDDQSEKKYVVAAAASEVPLDFDPRFPPGMAVFEQPVPIRHMLVDTLQELLRGTWAKLRYRGRRALFSDVRHSRPLRATGGELYLPAGSGRELQFPQRASVRLPATTMSQLMAICRTHKASFSGVLHAAVMAVLSSHLYPDAVFGRSRLAVSYRRFTGTDDDGIVDEAGNTYWGKRLGALRGVLVAPPTLLSAERAAILWQAAADYTHHINADLADTRRHRMAHGYRRIMGKRDGQIGWTIGLLGSQRHGTVEISNLGVFVPEKKEEEGEKQMTSTPADSDRWTITDIKFNVAAAEESVCCSLALGAVTLKGGDCNINMSYNRSIFPDARVALFRDKLEETLCWMATTS